MKQHIPWIFVLLFSVSGCARKNTIGCGSVELPEKEWIDSELNKLERVHIADTTVAFIKGMVLGKNKYEKNIVIDTLQIAAVVLQNESTQETQRAISDVNGHFSFQVNAGTYNMIFAYIGYSKLHIKNISIGTGELKEIIVTLGQGHGLTNYTVSKDDNFIKQK